MKFLGPSLLASFKDALPANEHVVLDPNKPEEKSGNIAKKNESESEVEVEGEEWEELSELKLNTEFL